ncbi:MAG: hypothetical protein WBE50_07450, partial [Methyloceanibacter sp.]
MPATGARIVQYPGEVGVGLQLGILVRRQARANVWPEIISWIKIHSLKARMGPVLRRAISLVQDLN